MLPMQYNSWVDHESANLTDSYRAEVSFLFLFYVSYMIILFAKGHNGGTACQVDLSQVVMTRDRNRWTIALSIMFGGAP